MEVEEIYSEIGNSIINCINDNLVKAMIESGFNETTDDYAGFALCLKVNDFVTKASGDFSLFYSGKHRNNIVTGLSQMKQLNLNELNSIFEEVLKGSVSEPYEQIPCSTYFIDNTLGEYQDLSECYSKFANLAEGVDREELDDFFKNI